MKRNIGIMGGTFNPIHNGHIQTALCAAKQYGLEEIWFVPAGRPPHKNLTCEVSPRQRLEMVTLALEPYPAFTAVDYEIKKQEPSYSYETLAHFSKTYPGTEFYFILGEDSLFTFLDWRNPELICAHAHILVAGRKGSSPHDKNAFETQLQRCRQATGGSFSAISMEDIPISSSDIRKRAALYEDITSMIPHAVVSYIEQHHLYHKRYAFSDLEELQKEMKKELNAHRFQHTLGVMHTAAALAMTYDYPMENAMIAGVLHDCAKCLSDEKRLHICKKENIPVRPVEARYPHLLHGKVGAFLARDKYHIKDPEILHAIEVHTTGCPGMHLLDEIIFVADYIEPGRDRAPELSEVRHLAFTNLRQCVCKILSDTVQYLDGRPEETDEITLETLAYYQNQEQKGAEA